MKPGPVVERYLKRATRGLWGRKRLEVREELTTHIDERVNAYMIAGLSLENAEEKVLVELGAPQMVSAGMTRLYTLPTVMGSSLALMALCLAVIALWPQGVAQSLEGTFYWPSPKCAKVTPKYSDRKETGECFAVSGTFWFSQQQLQRVLEAQGVQFSRLFASNAFSSFKIQFRDAKPVYVTPGIPGLEIYDDQNVPIPLTPGQLSLWHFLSTVSSQNTVNVAGWDNPVVKIGETHIRFGSSESPVSGKDFYNSYLEAVFFQDLSRNLVNGFRVFDASFYNDLNTRLRTSEKPLQRTSIRVNNDSKGIYGIVTYIDLEDGVKSKLTNNDKSAPFLMQVSDALDASNIRVQLPQGEIRFVESFDTGLHLKSGDSILIRLAGSNAQGKDWYEVVSPESVSLETP